jgi:tetratricopeptide (TPR) repeat protein
MGSCCPNSNKKIKETPISLFDARTYKSQQTVLSTKQIAIQANHNLPSNTKETHNVIQMHETSQQKIKASHTNSKKTTDISDLALNKEQAVSNSSLNFHEIVRNNHRQQVMSCSLADTTNILQASINAQRKNSIALIPRNQYTKEDESSSAFVGEGSTESEQQQRQMLLQYVTSWTEVALAYQQEGYFEESLDCIDSAIEIYGKLSIYPHLSLCLGTYLLAIVLLHSNIDHY